MKICISASGKNNDSLLDVRFVDNEYFQIHDTDTGEIKVLKMSEIRVVEQVLLHQIIN